MGSSQVNHLCHAQFIGEKLGQHGVAVLILGLVHPVEHEVVPHTSPLKVYHDVVVTRRLSSPLVGVACDGRDLGAQTVILCRQLGDAGVSELERGGHAAPRDAS